MLAAHSRDEKVYFVQFSDECLKGRFNMKRKYIGLAIIGLAAFLFGPSPAFAQIPFGTAKNFAVLAGTTVTNTGPTVITTGDVGVSPGSAVTGLLASQVVSGTIHSADAVALQAQNDLTTAYNAVAGAAGCIDKTGVDLGGQTLTPGVYCFTSSAFLTGTLTLDFQGNPNALFLFKTGSTLITAVNSQVLLINSGGTICPPNVFWQVGSSATLEVGSTFVGNILALTSITIKTGATLTGRALARNGAVTLDTDTVTACFAAAACPPITVNPATLPNGTIGIAYSATVSGSGGTAPYTFAVTSGVLPTGLSLNATTGVIAGTPTTAGTFDFTITATDSLNCPGSRSYTIVIAAPCPPITLIPATLPSGNVGIPFSATISAASETTLTNFTITAGALPSGLTLNSATGAITGTPTVPGLFSFTVHATDLFGCPAIGPYSILIGAISAAGTAGGPTLDSFGLAILLALLAVAGVFAVNRFTS
jgi:Ice-binding-like/Putative Ig domain